MRFNYKTIEDLRRDLLENDFTLPLSEDLSLLRQELSIGDKVIPNRLATHPMEGCDGLPDGSPGELTYRRYSRFASGGAGLIWFEAVAVNEMGKSNPGQLMITPNNAGQFRDLVETIRQLAKESMGHDPYLVLQLTHSGRFGIHKQIVSHYEVLDKKTGLSPDYPVMTDEELDQLSEDYLQAAKLGALAGFDAVDIKGCHRYLLSELLGAHERTGRYGGSYANRTQFFKNVMKAIKKEADIDLAIRLNVYDAIPYPYGWGTDSRCEPDLTEPVRFVQELESLGVRLFNVTASTPYLTPHISRPYDQPGRFGYLPPERPLKGVVRLLGLAREIQTQIPQSIVVGTGFSWLRHLAPYVGAGMIREGWAKVIGFGRGAFAYPDFARDILKHGKMDRNKTCITCSKCAELKSKGLTSGCVVRDPEIYVPVYRKLDLMEEREGGTS